MILQFQMEYIINANAEDNRLSKEQKSSCHCNVTALSWWCQHTAKKKKKKKN